MTNRIEIRIRNVYGEMKAYPVCVAAQSFAAIAGTKTLTFATLQLISNLGFEIHEVNGGLKVAQVQPGPGATTQILKMMAA